MCYVCNCFAWSLDLVQRTITFCLACCTACVVCCGLLVTAMAGIAYGYNYSFAEFITHTRSDVTVYMRRGQFDDNPDLVLGGNRKMGDEDDFFPANITSDYEEQDAINKDSEPLSNKWLKVHDIREYAKKLTKYSGDRILHSDVPEEKEQDKILKHTTSPNIRRMSKIPILIPTTVWRSGSTEIVLRNFLPLNDLTKLHTNKPKVNSYQENKNNHEIKSNLIEYSERQMKPIQPDIEIRINDIPERKLKPINDGAVNSQFFYDQDDPLDVENEDSIMYKPV